MTPEDFKIISDLTDRIKRLESKVKALEGKTKRWQPPTIEEVRDYCKERNKGVDPNQWYDYYTANGWMVGGKTKMKDWEASVRTWEKNAFNSQPVQLSTNMVESRKIPDGYGEPSENAITWEQYQEQKKIK